MKFSPDKRRLISYSPDDGIYFWDVVSGRLLRRHQTNFIQEADEYYTLTSFAFRPEQNLMASGSGNGTAQLWDAKSGRFLWRADAHKDSVTVVEFSPDGKTLAVGGRNQNLFLFDVETGNKLWQLLPAYQPSVMEIRLTREREHWHGNL